MNLSHTSVCQDLQVTHVFKNAPCLEGAGCFEVCDKRFGWMAN